MPQSPSANKLAGADLEQIRSRVEAQPAAAALLASSATAEQALASLTSGGFLAEATRLLAHALPRREGVWWACMCARHTAPPELPAPDRAALEAAELWVRKPTDENRRAGFAHAQEAGFGTPEAWAAVGAFWSGDSMSPAGQPPVAPAPHLAGTAIAGAVALASVRIAPERQPERLARFVESGRDIAAGGPGRLPPEIVQ